MGLYYSNQLKSGFKVIYNNEPCVIISNEFIKPGKGQAFFRVRLKNFLNQKFIEKTCKPMDFFKVANVVEIIATYIFTDGKVWVFMNNKNFEQIFVEEYIIQSVRSWLLLQRDYIITLWNDNPISVIYSHNFIELKVISTTSDIKSDTVNVSNKLAILSTGVSVKVPMFIQTGQVVRIDVRTGEYVSKIK